ncbi:hypothetical protein BOS5A_30114 [Bosea sp. EC-HK365B]|nr:hypothetical protein BOS5A_30114 [Bosea sp. EC-HK365B]
MYATGIRQGRSCSRGCTLAERVVACRRIAFPKPIVSDELAVAAAAGLRRRAAVDREALMVLRP